MTQIIVESKKKFVISLFFRYKISITTGIWDGLETGMKDPGLKESQGETTPDLSAPHTPPLLCLRRKGKMCPILKT